MRASEYLKYIKSFYHQFSSLIKRFKNYISLFALGFVIRSLPNLITSHPIGYDTIDYASQILASESYLTNIEMVLRTPFFLLVADTIFLITRLEPFIILRLLQPILYGLLTIAFFFTAKNTFRLSLKWAFFSVILFSFQTVTLRLSWDLFRNEIGLTFLLLALHYLKNVPQKSLILVFLSILVILSHQITSAIFIIIACSLILYYFKDGQIYNVKQLLLTTLPALLFFLSIVIYSSQYFPFIPPTSKNTPEVLSIPTSSQLPFPFLNYLRGDYVIDYSGSYLILLIDVVSLFIASYGVFLPFTVVGLKYLREKILTIWTFLCSLAFLSCLYSPYFGLFFWDRWLIMLVLPFTLYAVKGIEIFSKKVTIAFSKKMASRFLICILIFNGLLAISYLVLPLNNAISTYAFIPSAAKYSPTTMLRNTIPLDDVTKLRKALNWINYETNGKSCLLASDAFIDWAKLSLKTNISIVNYGSGEVLVGLSYARILNFSDVYWVWWTNGVGQKWYGRTPPNDFLTIYSTGTITLFKCG